MEDLLQLFCVFLIGLQKHSLKIHWQSVPIDKRTKLRGLLNFVFTKTWWIDKQTNRTSSLYLKTDSVKTRRALMCIQAMNASLKFTFSHRTSGPCGKTTVGLFLFHGTLTSARCFGGFITHYDGVFFSLTCHPFLGR